MILSVDTGLSNFGVSIIDPTGNIKYVETIKTKRLIQKNKSVADEVRRRIGVIAERLSELFAEWPIFEVTGELPTFGAQSSDAALSLTSGASIILTLCAAYRITPRWETPENVKLAFTDNPDASKKEIMEACCRYYGWPISYNEVRIKGKLRKDPVYRVLGQSMSAGYFEHIADSLAAYHACNKQKERCYV